MNKGDNFTYISQYAFVILEVKLLNIKSIWNKKAAECFTTIHCPN